MNRWYSQKSYILVLQDILSRTRRSLHVGSTTSLYFPTLAVGAGLVGSGPVKTILCFGTEGPLF